MWNPAQGNCKLVDVIAADVLGEPAAVTDEPADPTGCTRRAQSDQASTAMALNTHAETFDAYVAEARRAGLPSPTPLTVAGHRAGWYGVEGLSRLIWVGEDGRLWAVSYSGTNTAAKKDVMVRAAEKVDRYIVKGGAAPSSTLAPAFGVAQPPAGTTSGTAVGLGAVKPQRFELSTHSTTAVFDITWSSWGGASAVGAGKAKNGAKGPSMAEAPIEPVTIRATLGTCGGKPAYAKVTWTFPGGQEAGDGFDLCDLESNWR